MEQHGWKTGICRICNRTLPQSCITSKRNNCKRDNCKQYVKYTPTYQQEQLRVCNKKIVKSMQGKCCYICLDQEDLIQFQQDIYFCEFCYNIQTDETRWSKDGQMIWKDEDNQIIKDSMVQGFDSNKMNKALQYYKQCMDDIETQQVQEIPPPHPYQWLLQKEHFKDNWVNFKNNNPAILQNIMIKSALGVYMEYMCNRF